MNTPFSARWDRSLDSYPGNAWRTWYLALTVISAIMLYYQLFTLGAVAPLVQAHFHLALSNYAYSLILASALGALAALVGSLSDRIGRANLIVFGLLATSLCTLAIAFTTWLWPFLLLYWGLSFIDGVLITAMIALMRDFSPRLGRATAMGFWSLGPVGGSFLASLVAGLTLPVFHTWQSQYVIAGCAGLAAFLACLLGLRELSAGLRDQVMTSLREKALVEARAGRIDVEAALKHPWRQMLRPRLVFSTLGINLILLMYLVARGFFVIFLSNSFRFSLAEANGVVSACWVAFVISAVAVGFLSDALRVRKPLVLLGVIALIIVTLLFIIHLGEQTSAVPVAVLLALMGTCFSIILVPWLTAYSETVEDINPALVATGSAVEIFITRSVTIAATLALPLVVGSGQGWGTWWWICLAGQVLFLPTILLVTGSWNPARARRAARAQEQEQVGAVPSHVG